MGYGDEAWKTLRRHFNGAHEIEAQQGKIGEIIGAQGLAPQMSVQEAQAPEARLPGPVSSELGNLYPFCITDKNIEDVAPAVDEDANLATDLTGELAEIPGKLRRYDTVRWDASLKDLFQKVPLPGLEPQQVSLKLLDKRSFLSSAIGEYPSVTACSPRA
jgi:hypothetical protein